ncbi:hypothetical protein QFC21_004390 [Naganishia friedmannii]|uniref:Uncharacterized protein n=1 Tax=Naganishia friedmannii TaxID=89922 RepID=A0ACC2VII1_9TREE|nr:hypothetical protein QFC21_004390 [Naganishia friedmannii]
MSAAKQDVGSDNAHDEHATPRPKIPRAAFICGLAALNNKSSRKEKLAFTTGLTLACIPAFRKQRHRSAAGGRQGIQFLSNAGLMRAPMAAGRLGIQRSSAPRIEGSGGGGLSRTAATATAEGWTVGAAKRKTTDPHILDDPSPTLSPVYPEEHDSGPGSSGGSISPLFALGAFGIATGLVVATAGATALAVAKILDVRDMDEFSAKMRQYTQTLLPTMSENIYSPPPPPSPLVAALGAEMDEFDPSRGVDEEDSIVRGWFGEVIRELEDDRRKVVEERQARERERERERVV